MALWTLSGTTRVSQYISRISWCKMKITQADAPTIRMDCNPNRTNWCPHLYHPTILRRMPFLTQPSLGWDRHQICKSIIWDKVSDGSALISAGTQIQLKHSVGRVDGSRQNKLETDVEQTDKQTDRHKPTANTCASIAPQW